MKRWVWGVALGVCVCAAAAEAETSANRIIAFVNQDVITEGDVQDHVNALMQQQHAGTMAPTDQTQMRQVVLQRLIEDRLILQEATKKGLTVSSDKVLERLRAVQQQLETPEAYAQMLREANLSEEQLKKKIREQLLSQQIIAQEVRTKIIVSPSEMIQESSGAAAPAAGAEEARAQHFLVRVTDRRLSEQAQALAAQFHEQLLKGGDFNQLVERYTGAMPDVEGKTLEWVPQGQLMPELDQVLFHLKPGEISDPIQTRLGFHVVKVLERRVLSSQDLSGARQRLLMQLYQEKFGAAMTQWLQELKQHAYVEVVNE